MKASIPPQMTATLHPAQIVTLKLTFRPTRRTTNGSCGVSLILSPLHVSVHVLQTVIPSWLEQPPTNLGERSHGKLKADQWLQLFIVFLPLILPEIWSASSSQNDSLLQNFHDLVACTNIICAYSITKESADLYHDYYICYLKSSKIIFLKAKMRPNHHFALHNAELMKFWGPLIKLSEFPFEQDNGIMQKINTNSHLCMFCCI
jgi:hypothetical protein